MALPQPGTRHMPLPFPTAPCLPKYFPFPGPAPPRRTFLFQWLLPSPFPSLPYDPSPPQGSQLQGHSRVHGLIVAVLLPHRCGRGDIGGPDHGPQDLHEVRGQRGLRGNNEHPSGMPWEGSDRGHEAEWPRQDPSGLWSPAPPWSSSCGAPGLPPAPAPSAGPCCNGTRTATWELHRTGTLPSPAACLALPHADTLRWLQPHARVSLPEGPGSHQCLCSGSCAVPSLGRVTAFTMAPTVTVVPMPAQVSPKLRRGS